MYGKPQLVEGTGKWKNRKIETLARCYGRPAQSIGIVLKLMCGNEVRAATSIDIDAILYFSTKSVKNV